MHEDIDISLHLMGKDLKTVYSPRMTRRDDVRDGWIRR